MEALMKKFAAGIGAVCLAAFIGCDNSASGKTGVSTLDERPAGVYDDTSGVLIAPYAGLPDTLAKIATIAGNGGSYTVILGSDETVAPITISAESYGAATITLKGSSAGVVTLALSGQGSLFSITGTGADNTLTLKLDQNITLSGHDGNSAALVTVGEYGRLLVSSNAKISGNTNALYAAPDVSEGPGIPDAPYFDTVGAGFVNMVRGGGVYVATHGVLTMTGGSITGNTVEYIAKLSSTTPASYNGVFGGGVYVAPGGTFTLAGGTVSNNTATNQAFDSSTNGWYTRVAGGAGITIAGNAATVSAFTMTGGSVTGNTAKGPSVYGGGIFIDRYSDFAMSGGTVSNNTAYAPWISPVTYGGGIYMDGSGRATVISGGSIKNNKAISVKEDEGTDSAVWSYAGGLFFKGSKIEDAEGVLVLKGNTEISGNSAETSSENATKGGGVFASANKVEISGNVLITQNSADEGGGAHVSAITTLSGNMWISENKAKTGAGFYVAGPVNNEITATTGIFTITENAAISGNTASGQGGGISFPSILSAKGVISVAGGKIFGNAATGYGGGVYLSGINKSFEISGGEVAGNRVTGGNAAGGGVYSGAFKMTGGEIFGNTAESQTASTENAYNHAGGGVWAASAFSKTGGTIYGNNAGGKSNKVLNGVPSLEGHAVWLNTNPPRKLDSTVSGNVERENPDDWDK